VAFGLHISVGGGYRTTTRNGELVLSKVGLQITMLEEIGFKQK
jgi:hypothetical protein